MNFEFWCPKAHLTLLAQQQLEERSWGSSKKPWNDWLWVYIYMHLLTGQTYYAVKPRRHWDEYADLGGFIQSRVTKYAVYNCVLQITEYVCDLFTHFHHELGDRLYFPSGAEKIYKWTVFAMFHLRVLCVAIQQQECNNDLRVRCMYEPLILDGRSEHHALHISCPSCI